jgi:glycosyltransferase involved in cell wall biosynthesis
MNYQTDYWTYLERLARGGRVRFLGPVYGEMRVEFLHLGAYAYLHGHEVGGTNPSLLKAMGCANLALALDTTFNADVLGGTGMLWDKRPGSLAERIRWAEGHPQEVARLGAEAQQRIRDRYTWDRTAEAHDAFFREVARRRGILA